MKEQITTSNLSPFLPAFLQTGLICKPIAFPFLPVYDTKKAEFFGGGEMARTAAISIQDFETIVLLDEYDTPMQETYVHKYWEGALKTFINMDLHSKRKMC